jgi:hypothetical protein
MPEQMDERPRRRMTVMASHYGGKCESCCGTAEFLLMGKAGGICLDCANLGHLEFLPSYDAALTRRARKASRMSAVVMGMNTSRRRYGPERQGILVEPAAAEQAARECLADDAEVRAPRATRAHGWRARQDRRFRDDFAAAIRQQFPGCPADRVEAIAFHIAARTSGRPGLRSVERVLDRDAVLLAVVESVRHVDTDYGDLIESGVDRKSALAQVHERVEDVVNAWREGVVMLDG